MRHKIRVASRLSFVSSAMLLTVMSFHPMNVLADSSNGASDATTPTTSSDQSSSSSSNSGSGSSTSTTGTSSSSSSNNNKKSQTGPTQPTGPSANTFTYNAATGMWENAYYIWNPNTDQTQPITPQTYSYNPATGMWDTTQWIFDAATNQYVPNVIAVTTPPAGAPTSGGPAAVSDDSSAATNTPTDSTSNTSGSSNGNTGSQSTTANGNFNLFYNANISNTLNSNAQTGNASVDSNTLGGDSTSGNALDIENVENLLQSSATGASTFTANINGDVDGDILINPSNIPQQPGSSEALNNLDVNNSTNSAINNTINLGATSGNAGVTNNTTGGSATSGSADSVADIINLLNSAIGSGQSFVGVVNIFGSLNGDILLPSDFLNTLLASNAATPTPSATQNDNNQTIDDTNSNNQAINNDITTDASTGQAAVADNTSAGSATTGNAATNVTVLNLTGSQIVGSNDVLVFVNVLGTWVGLIMNAPAGTTAAELGGGISQDSTVPTTVDTATLNSANNDAINNNIIADANSGNANVSNNTNAGNATTGNATSSVNLVNLIDSQLDLSNWFGILFINVFGTWDGNFGVAPNQVASTQNSSSTNDQGQPTSGSTSNTNTTSVTAQFPATDNTLVDAGLTPGPTTSNTQSLIKNNVLVSSKTNTPITQNHNKATLSIAPISLIIGFTGIVLLGTERVWSTRQSHRK